MTEVFVARQKKSDTEDVIKVFLLLIFALGTALAFAASFLIKNVPRLISYFVKRTSKREGPILDGICTNRPTRHTPMPLMMDTPMSSGNLFLDRAREREGSGDYLGARVEYMKCIEDLKRSNQGGNLDVELELAQKEYDEFVKRDPVYAALISRLMPIIKDSPGMLQSDITKNFKKATDWSSLYSYTREVTKDDIGYALYFAAKQGIILRTKKGRSYEMTVVEDVPVVPDTPVK